MSFVVRHGAAAFADEAGGHRWQRVPPNEKRGRVHTSTVTVAVLPVTQAALAAVKPSDVEWTTTRGSGPGGQHRNVTESCVVATHRPTGVTVRCDSERSQHQNRRLALETLSARIHAAQEAASQRERAGERRTQVGSGMRGDKRRTIRERDGQVNDHVTGRRWSLDSYLSGRW